MDYLLFVLFVLVVVAVIFGALGGYVAREKCRPLSEGWTLGILFGPLGAIVEGLLPTIDPMVEILRKERQADEADKPAVDEAERIARYHAMREKQRQDKIDAIARAAKPTQSIAAPKPSRPAPRTTDDEVAEAFVRKIAKPKAN